MNFTVIPFFLVANVVVDDTNDWSNGPEFIYDINITLLSFDGQAIEPTTRGNVSIVMRCRPKSETSIFCTLSDTIAYSIRKGKPEALDVHDEFEMTFNPNGVESLLFKEDIEREQLRTMKVIANELSIGADFSQNSNALPTFVTKQSHLMGECTTLFTVFHYDKSLDELEVYPAAKKDYTLDVLTLPEQNTNSTVVIKKKTDRKRCVVPPEDLHSPNVSPNLVKSISKMQITNDGTFHSQTDINLSISKMKKQKLHVIVSIMLRDIQPAKEPLPSVTFYDSTSIRFTDQVEINRVQ